MTDGIKELLHIQNTMSEFLPVGLPMPLEVDNKGAGYMAENDINNKRTKHIDIRYHFIREFIKNGTIDMVFNTPSGPGSRHDDTYIRSTSITQGIPCVTTMSGIQAVVSALNALHKGPTTVRPIQEGRTTHEPAGVPAAK